MDDKLTLPIRNIPVLRVDAEYAKLSLEHVVSKVNMAFQRHDLVEGREIVALYFKDPVRVNYPSLELFAKSMEAALPNSIAKRLPIILIFQRDIRLQCRERHSAGNRPEHQSVVRLMSCP